MQKNIQLSSPTHLILNVYEYQAHLGQTHPVWQPVPQYYYPLSCKQVTFYVLFVILTILGVLGIFIGFTFWAVSGLSTYVLIWSVIVIIGLIVSFVFLFLGGKDRRVQEKLLIQETNRKQKQMAFKQK